MNRTYMIELSVNYLMYLLNDIILSISLLVNALCLLMMSSLSVGISILETSQLSWSMYSIGSNVYGPQFSVGHGISSQAAAFPLLLGQQGGLPALKNFRLFFALSLFCVYWPTLKQSRKRRLRVAVKVSHTFLGMVLISLSQGLSLQMDKSQKSMMCGE